MGMRISGGSDARGRLRVGVPAALLDLAPAGGHGKIWNRVLTELRHTARIVPLTAAGRRFLGAPLRSPEVLLASGHDDLPASRAPLVVEVHEAGWFNAELQSRIDADFLEYIATRTERAVHTADRVITLSEAARRDLITAYDLDPERVHAVHPGVDPTFANPPGDGRAIVAHARRGRDAPYVLYAATLHPRKNLALLREVMSAMAREGMPHVLVVAGAGAPDRADSAELEREAAAELDGAPDRIVRFAGPSDQTLAALMAGADVFCLPSLYEGFGLTVLEAMACGAPVLVSDRGALPEVVADAGVVAAPTAEAMRAALRALLRDRANAERLGHAAALRAQGFTWERTAAGWLSVLLAAARQPYTRSR